MPDEVKVFIILLFSTLLILLFLNNKVGKKGTSFKLLKFNLPDTTSKIFLYSIELL